MYCSLSIWKAGGSAWPESRGIPTKAWMQQMARNATDESCGYLEHRRYALHDRDTKFCSSFRATLTTGGISRSSCHREVRT
jgi:hypothetical protein